MRLISQNDSTVALVNDQTGEALQWDVSIFDRTRFSTVDNVFRDINDYWQHIGVERQQRIWDVYKQLHTVWYEVSDATLLARTLVGLIGKLYEEMPESEIEHWVRFYSKVRYPDNLLDVHDIEDPNPGRTYLRGDYQGLVVMSVAIRPMVPIWGEYIYRIKNEVGSIYKEYTAMRLLSKTWIVTSPHVERLKLYIQSSNLHMASNVAAILSGLGTDELPDFLLSFVIIRRIAVGDIDAHPERGSIISNIYGFISSTLKDLDRKFGGGVKEKHPEDSGMEDESSMLEAYKVKQDITAGDVATFAVYVENFIGMAKRIDPTIPDEMVRACVENAVLLQTLSIQPHHLTLCQWITATVLPARSLPLLNKNILLHCMGVSQALLWHWEFPELAALITCCKVEHEREMTLTNDVRMRMSNELTEALNQIYPHGDQNEKQSSTRRANPAYIAILALTKELSSSPWEILAPDDIVKACPTINNRRIMTCPVNAVELLARLVIRINQN